MRKFLFPIAIIALIILVGFFVYRTVLNYQELIEETGTPSTEGEAATSTEGEVEEEKEAPTITISPALEGKSILMIVPYNDFNETEYSALRNLFASSGGTIKIASSQTGAATGDKGGILPLSFSVEEISLADFDALVFVGGSRILIDFDTLDLPETAKEEISRGKAVALIGEEVIIPADDFSGFEEFGMKIIEALTSL